MADNQTIDALTSRQHKAISELLHQPTIRQAAEVSGIPEKTIYNWLKNGEFAEAYRDARRAAVQQATARLQYASSSAVIVLCQLMAHSTPAVKLGAARTVLEFAIKAVELEDLAARLAALEQAYAAKL